MFTFQIFSPSPALQPYVEKYQLLKLDGPAGWQQTLIPSNVQNIGFLLQGGMPACLMQDQPAVVRSYIMGQIEYPMTVEYPTKLEIFSILFKPAGMYQLFRIPMQLFTNTAVDFELIAGKAGRELTEKILEPIRCLRRVALIESFLLRLLSQNSRFNIPGIGYACSLIEKQNGYLRVKELACRVNMCERNLERHFIENVGISPKTFTGTTRMKKVLQMIETRSKLRWTDIAYTLDYADQAHFIHDFKKFTGQTPSEYFLRRTDFEHSLYGEQILSDLYNEERYTMA